jgi:hypothetical protein
MRSDFYDRIQTVPALLTIFLQPPPRDNGAVGRLLSTGMAVESTLTKPLGEEKMSFKGEDNRLKGVSIF